MRNEPCHSLWVVPLLLLAACSGDGYRSPTAPEPLSPPPPTEPTQPVEFTFPPPAGSQVYLGTITTLGAKPSKDCVAKAANADAGRTWTARLIVHQPGVQGSSGSLEARLLYGPQTLGSVTVTSDAKGMWLALQPYDGMDENLEYGKSCPTSGWFYASEAQLPSPRNGAIAGPGTIVIREMYDNPQRAIYLQVNFDLQPPG